LPSPILSDTCLLCLHL